MDISSTSALIATIILGSLTIFQIALILGAPIGKFAWGGKHTVLPRNLRIASVFSIVIYGILAVLILSKAGLLTLAINEMVLTVLVWISFAYFVLGVFLNGISRSKSERVVMTPVAACLAVAFFIVAIR